MHRSDQITLVCLFHIKVQEAEDMTDHYGDFYHFVTKCINHVHGGE